MMHLVRVMTCGLLLLCVPCAAIALIIHFNIERQIIAAIIVTMLFVLVYGAGLLLTDGDKWPWERSK